MKKVCLALATVILLSSCYFPPYREELSLALPVTKKMDTAAIVGPIDRGPWEFEGRDLLYYPSKDALRNRNSTVRGFFGAFGDRSARLMFVDHDGSNYYIGSENSFPLENIDDKSFVFWGTVLEDGSDVDGIENAGIIVFDNEKLYREYFHFDQFLGFTPYDLNAGLFAVGACFFPNDTLGLDRLYTLRRDPVTGDYVEEEFDADNGGPIGGRGPFPLPGVPDGVTNGFYSFHVPTARSYLSVYDGARREYRNFSWDGAFQLQVLTEIDRRIDLVLSNGWLFSRDGNQGYVYNSDGELINSFLMGGLSLVCEMYDSLDLEYRVVFTIPIWAPVQIDFSYWEERLHFLVYWIPTEQLAKL